MIALGSKVRDKISGFEGTATSRHVSMDGSIQFGVQPRVEKTGEPKLPKAITFDVAQLEIVAAPDSGIRAEPYVEDIGFKLGEMVEDKSTSYQGIATTRSDFLNGCCYISVQGKGKKGEKPPERERVEYFLLVKVGPGVSKITDKVRKALAATATPTSPPRSGGPSREVVRGK